MFWRVLVSIDEETLVEILLDYLPRTRWWIKRRISRSDIKIEKLLEGKEGFIVFFNDSYNNYYIPCIRINKSDLNTRLLERNLYVEINSNVYVEAEYSPHYFKLLDSLRDSILSRKYTSIDGRFVLGEPLTLDTTNVLGKITLENSSSLVVKGYRLLLRENIEPLMMSRLWSKGFFNIPVLYRVYSTWTNQGEMHLSIVTGFIGRGFDGGYPFYLKLKEYLNTEYTRSSNVDDYLLLDHALKLGRIIGEMHIKLNSEYSREFFGLEEITRSDIKEWTSRIENRYNSVLRSAEKLISSDLVGLRKEIEEDLYYWINELDSIKVRNSINTALSIVEEMENTYKGRIHQDLHLGQMIYLPEMKDFIITDFEGEPARRGVEKFAKEPLIRDLASMIQSFNYLAIVTYSMHSLNTSLGGSWEEYIANACRKLAEDKNLDLWLWVKKHVDAMISEYNQTTLKDRVSVDLFNYNKPFREAFRRYLYPWVIERALYELDYELNYRPLWFPIPILTLTYSHLISIDVTI